ncbi:MAG: HD-GYP domain-containing protein [Eubacteriales bacterium]
MKAKKSYNVNCAMADVGYLKLSDEAPSQEIYDLPKQRDTVGLNRINTRTISDAQIISIAKEPVVGQIISFGWQYEEEITADLKRDLITPEDYISIQKLLENSNAGSKMIDSTLKSLFRKNLRVRLHSKRVGELCKAIATKMNLAKADIHRISMAGLLHDIGKIAISNEMLEKPGKLDAGETQAVRKHSEIGYSLLSTIESFSKTADCILEHHERWDGKGYPKGISGEEISLEARIIAIADTFDAMTSDRPYRKTVSRAEAIAEIKAKAGTQFDPAVVKMFLEMELQKA